MHWWKDLKGNVKKDVLLSRYTTFKIGGKADFLIEPLDLKDLKKILKIAKKDKLKVFILGGGSNLLIHDEGIRGIVIRLNKEYFRKLELLSNSYIKVGAGVRISEVLRFCIKNDLSGLEFLVGIPGTIGGALIMNAGGKYGTIGEKVKQVKVIDYEGNIKILGLKNLNFDYRSSNLDRFIVLEALLKLTKDKKKDILKKISYFQRYRRVTQEFSYPSAGCVFKNPEGLSAGELIDLCGLKGKSIGDAMISFRHANFIINRGKASADDVLRLIDYVKCKVKERFNVDLELEIKVW